MVKRLIGKYKENKGFTLIEMLVVIAIMGVLIGLVSVSVHGYLVTSYMNRVNETARTVFLACQNYLTEQKQLGQLSEFNSRAGMLELSGDSAGRAYSRKLSADEIHGILAANTEGFSQADWEDYKSKYTTDTIRYIAMNGSSDASNPVYQIVKSYLDDPDILEHTFLLEYDMKTGVVRSVFYSEKTDSLSDYSMAGTESRSNNIKRDYDSLRPKRQGYYGVNTSGTVGEDAIDLYIPKNVKLVNGERLYLQWTESNYLSPQDIADGYINNYNEAFDEEPELKDFLVYDVEVYAKAEISASDPDKLLFTVRDIGRKAPDKTLWPSTLDAADDAGSNATGESKLAPVIALDTNTNTYTLLLDDIHHSIFDTYNKDNAELKDYYAAVYENVNAGNIVYCKITPRLQDAAPAAADTIDVPASSNLQSACFAGGAEFTDNSYAGAPFTAERVFGNGSGTQDGSDKTEDKAFCVSTARHFNNIRYASNISHFRQIPLKLTEDASGLVTAIDWSKPELHQSINGGSRINTDLFEPFVFLTGENGKESDSDREVFLASYQVKKSGNSYCTLENISINKLNYGPAEKYVGIFRKLGRRGSENALVDGMNLKNIRVSGGCYVGTVAGASLGTIQNVTVTSGTGNSDSEVAGGYYVGGITGVSGAGARLSRLQVDADINGGQFDAGIAPEGTGTDAVSSGHYIGGVAGLNEGNAGIAINGASGEIVTAVLDSTGKASTKQRSVTGTKYVGGVFGAVKKPSTGSSEVENLINYNNVSIAEDVRDYLAEGIQDFGGITGYNGKDSEIKNSVNRGALEPACKPLTDSGDAAKLRLPENIGGIAGRNEGILKECSNALEKTELADDAVTACVRNLKKDGRLPVYLGTNVGGLVGYNTEDGQLSGCLNENGLVTGYTVVGGVAGKNEGTSDYTAGGLAARIGHALSSLGRRGNVSVKGAVIGTGNVVGGIYGSSAGNTIDARNQAHVFGRAVVGGIVAQNGGVSNYAFADGSEPGLDGSSDIRAYLEPYDLNTANKDAKVENCENNGFVYALKDYAGGIAGINMGQMLECESIVDLSGGGNQALADALGGAGGISDLAKADCVGGIVGLNAKNAVLRCSAGVSPSYANIYVDNFGGGIAGINNGILGGYTTIQGNIYGKGQAVGGFIGMNLEKDTLKNNIINDSMKIYGNYFVGGIIGLNVATDKNVGGNPLTITGTTRNSGSDRGIVSGDAYVGGIIGYNTYVDDESSLTALYNNELMKLITDAYEVYTPTAGGSSGNSIITVFKDCYSRTRVTANRYVGGIVGYNSADANLWITHCINYGAVSIKDEGKSKDKDYYFIGGITGRNSANGVIDQCTNDGAVKSPSKYLGGLCEVNEGYVQYCQAGATAVDESAITGGNSVGGLVGLNSSKVVCCHAGEFANINGGSNTGGLVGTNDGNGLITGVKTNAVKLDQVTGWKEPAAAQSCTSNATITGTGNNIGGIAGLNQGALERVYVEAKANVKGVNNVGGFIGNNQGTIDSSGRTEIRELVNNANTVEGVHLVGGIVGVHEATKIVDCVNNGSVKATGSDGYNANGFAGGITGNVDIGVTVDNCVNYGKVVSEYGVAGGITGYNQGTVENSKNYGTVEGAASDANDRKAAGGVVGTNAATGTVADCISGDWKDDPDKADNPYKDVDNHENYVYGQAVVGGLIGKNEGKIVNDDRDSRIVSINMKTDGISKQKHATELGGIVGRMDGDMKTLKNFEYEGTITAAENCEGTKYIGGIIGKIDKNYTLENCTFDGSIKGYANTGNGSTGGVGAIAGMSSGTIIVHKGSADGREIYSAATKDSSVEGRNNVGGLAGYAGSGHKLLLKDDTQNWEPDSKHIYTNCTTVSGRSRIGGCYGTSGLSALAYYENRGRIILPEHSSNFGSASYVGGILGYSDKKVTIENCINKGTVGEDKKRGGDKVGGIVGGLDKGSVIRSCENQGLICDGNNNIGGIVGKLEGSSKMSDCLNTGEIRLQDAGNTGGLAGYVENGSIDKALNRGNIKSLAAGKSNVGGIFGAAKGTGSFTECINEGNVESRNNLAGGIGGKLDVPGSGMAHKIRVSDCVNKGEVSGLDRIGGILGEAYYGNRADNTFHFYGNQNEAAVMGREFTGGLIGRFSSEAKFADAKIENCVNKGIVNGKLPEELKAKGGNVQNIGGCIGYLSIHDQVSGLNNESEVLAVSEDGASKHAVNIGGIVGYLAVKTDGKPFYHCKNSGRIEVTGFQNVQYIGGIAGTTRENSLLQECGNTGTIKLNHAVNQVRYIGGIAGSSQNNSVLDMCENGGAIETEVNQNYFFELGGIAGMAADNTLINECINRAKLDFSMVNTVNQYRIGGILGETQSAGVKLQYCTNYGSVLGNTDYADAVGGIVGRTVGLVYSCSTRNENGSRGKIQGRDRIGGIAGYAADETCKITSIRNLDGVGYDYSINRFDVSGKKSVGGVVGEMAGATLQTVHVDKNVIITALNSGDHNSRKAGGIVGNNSFHGDNRGIVANCYGFGRVVFESGVEKKQYLGGVSGYRNYKNNKAAAAVKHSYYLSDDADYKDWVDESRPANTPASVTGEVVLAIGNEPPDKYFQDSDDGEADNTRLETGERYRWSQETYRNLYRILHDGEPAEPDPVPGEDNWDDLDTILDNIAAVYDLNKLPVPETEPVTGDTDFIYNMPVHKIPGFCKEVKVSLYDYDRSDADIEDGAAAPLLELTYDVGMDEQIYDISFDVSRIPDYKNWVGKPIKVAIQAVGYTDGSEENGDLVYTVDSDLKVVQDFVIMPPLPIPEMPVLKAVGEPAAEALLVEQNENEVTFQIKNWGKYTDSGEPANDYPNLAAHTIYEQYLNGLKQLQITDYFKTAANAGPEDNNSYKTVWTIDASDIDPVTGRFTIDYTGNTVYEKIKGSRKWHEWKIEAAAENQGLPIGKDDVDADSVNYRYFSSEEGRAVYYVEAVTQLEPPTDLKWEYSGGTDWRNEDNTPSYSLSFRQSVSPKDVIKGYRLVISNEDESKSVTVEIPQADIGAVNPYTYTLPKDTLTDALNGLGVDLEPESAATVLKWSMQTLKKDDAVYYIDSETADGMEITVLKKENAVASMEITRQEGVNKHTLQLDWSADPNTSDEINGNRYTVTYKLTLKKDDGTEIEKFFEPAESADSYSRSCIIDFEALDAETAQYYQNGYTMEATIIKHGETDGPEVLTLDSNDAVFTYTGKPDMKPVKNLSGEFDRMQWQKEENGSEKEYAVFLVEWDNPDNTDADNCSGFEVMLIPEGGTDELGKVTIPFKEPPDNPYELYIPMEELSAGNYRVQVITKSAGDAKEATSQSATIVIPAGRLDTPIVTDIKGQDGGTDITLSASAEDVIPVKKSALENLVYSMEWKNTQTDTGKTGYIEGYIIRLLDENAEPLKDASGNVILYERTDTGQDVSKQFAADLASKLAVYAGRQLQLEVTLQSKEVPRFLPSLPGRISFYVPKIQLENPAAKGSSSFAPDTMTAYAEWTHEAEEEGRKGQRVTVTGTDSTGAKIVIVREIVHNTGILALDASDTADPDNEELKDSGIKKITLVSNESDGAVEVEFEEGWKAMELSITVSGYIDDTADPDSYPLYADSEQTELFSQKLPATLNLIGDISGNSVSGNSISSNSTEKPAVEETTMEESSELQSETAEETIVEETTAEETQEEEQGSTREETTVSEEEESAEEETGTETVSSTEDISTAVPEEESTVHSIPEEKSTGELSTADMKES